MKVLFVGDPHVVGSELADCWRLIDCIESVQAGYQADVLCILGDLYHNHSTVDLEVQEFWRKALIQVKGSFETVVIVSGNHDRPNNRASKANALYAHQSQDVLIAIDEPVVFPGYLFCPFTPYEDQLVKWANLAPADHVLVCHQTFQGAVFENGVPAHDCFDQAQLPQKLVISGHIHTPMDIPGLNGGPRVLYTGSPRWRIASDANTTRNLVGLGPDGIEYFQTSKFCTPMYHFEDTESAPISFKYDKKAKYVIDLKGSKAWINERRGLYPFARIRAYPTSREIKIKESEGIDRSLAKWVEAFQPPNGTPKSILKERAHNLWPNCL